MQPDYQGELLEFVRSYLIDEEDPAIGATTLLFEEGWINSINILSLIGFVEGRLGRRLEDSEIVMSNFTTVEAIAHAFFHS